MKTLALLIATALALASCTPLEAADPRRPSESDIVAAYEADAIAQAKTGLSLATGQPPKKDG